VKRVLSLLCLMSATVVAQPPGVTQPPSPQPGTLPAQTPKAIKVSSQNVAGVPGEELLMVTVEFAPGQSDAIQRQDVDAFIYVSAGAVKMHAQGGPELTLGAGQAFYEGPQKIHIVARNASKVESAKFVVFLVKEKGTPILAPVK
jgi:quercetin dioxygenase-like cupin family protein